MNSFLKKIESEDVIIYTEQVYSTELLNQCRAIHKKLVEEGKIKGDFNSDKWMGYSGVKEIGLNFSLDSALYKKHIGKELGISETTIKNMLRCYAIYCNGIYVYQTISRDKINVIKSFLEKYNDNSFRLEEYEVATIIDFLGFINTPENQIDELVENIKLTKRRSKSQRKLSPIINYLVVENEINNIYRNNPDNQTFIKWFPIYFWVNITFILPLRATEMLLTPHYCISREGSKTFLTIRRTTLKKRKRTVYYDINKDYKEFKYEIPDSVVVKNIEKYLELTNKQERRFLFEYSEDMINNMLSLQSFNRLIFDFMQEYIIGNPKYDFAKYATGITEFEMITAGDSRPIAMANLYFQNAGEDICRQLADHISINTSSGYYTNISETIWASSIIQLQKKLDFDWRESTKKYEQVSINPVSTGKSVCVSQKRVYDEENLDDCIEQGHLSDCMGCKYYRPSRLELDTFMNLQQKKVDECSKRIIEFMNNIMSMKEKESTLEELFLSVQTEGTRYRMGCNIKAEEELKEWQKLKSIQKTNC